MPDVDAVDIDFAAHTATIRMKAGKTTDRERVAAALGTGGYGVESFAESRPAGQAEPGR